MTTSLKRAGTVLLSVLLLCTLALSAGAFDQQISG